MTIAVNKTLLKQLAIEVHERDQSRIYLGVLNARTSLILDFPELSKIFELKMRRAKFVGEDCDPKNLQKSNKCMKNFIGDKMNCSLPWDKKPTKRICSNPQDLFEYRQLRLKISRGYYTDELHDFGCALKSMKNCKETIWTAQREISVEDSRVILLGKILWQKILNPDEYGIVTISPVSTTVEETQEYYSYTKMDLLADIGGYMGLLLGASILSLFEDFILKFCF